MDIALAVCVCVLAVAAALRSTWSPCGLSMLSSITPLGEAARGQRFVVSARWFGAGAILGGACLGGVAAAGATAVAALGPSAPTRLAIGAALCGLAALADVGMLGVPVPMLRRQVNELWLDRYRPWVYAGGFGWQIGVGLATYVMTTAVVVLLPLAALTGSPWFALAACTGFGATRGASVHLGARVRRPADLLAVHRRLDHLAGPSRLALAGLLGALGLGLGLWAWPPVVAALAGVGLVGASATLRHRRRLPTAESGAGGA